MQAVEDAPELTLDGRAQIDLSHEYWLQVFEPAIGEWQAGRTPNPDVSCNRCVAT